MKEFLTRKRNRLEGYDYSKAGSYFITICVKDRHELLGTVVGATVLGRPYVKLNKIGTIVDTAITHNSRNDANIDYYIIMPNHIHMIVKISPKTGDRGRSPLQSIIRNMKSYITKQIGFSPWQKSFHDHIIRNDDEYNRIAEYIVSNPATWEADCFHPSKTEKNQ